jgi:hypothetical protein
MSAIVDDIQLGTSSTESITRSISTQQLFWKCGRYAVILWRRSEFWPIFIIFSWVCSFLTEYSSFLEGWEQKICWQKSVIPWDNIFFLKYLFQERVSKVLAKNSFPNNKTISLPKLSSGGTNAFSPATNQPRPRKPSKRVFLTNQLCLLDSCPIKLIPHLFTNSVASHIPVSTVYCVIVSICSRRDLTMWKTFTRKTNQSDWTLCTGRKPIKKFSIAFSAVARRILASQFVFRRTTVLSSFETPLFSSSLRLAGFHPVVFHAEWKRRWFNHKSHL